MYTLSNPPKKYDLPKFNRKTLPDVIKPNLKILFVGINPGLYTAAIGHHFGRPGNRFWPALYKSKFTNILLTPYDEENLLRDGIGITNVVSFATATAAEVSESDFKWGGNKLKIKIKKYKPKVVAFLGVGAYRIAYNQPKAKVGLQPVRIATSYVWVLPNPSGLNANYQLPDLVRLFGGMRRFVEKN